VVLELYFNAVAVYEEFNKELGYNPIKLLTWKIVGHACELGNERSQS
jgi:hypothetical protein